MRSQRKDPRVTNVQRRLEKLEWSSLKSDAPIEPCVYLIQADGDTGTYSVTRNGHPVDENDRPGRRGVVIIVDGARGEEMK